MAESAGTDTLPRVRQLDIKRRMTPSDIANVADLLSAVERADGARPLSDHHWLDLMEGGRDGFAGLLAWETGHHHPVAYAQVSRGNDSWAVELVIDPHHRYEALDIGPELLRGALDIVAREGGGEVHWWVFEPTGAHEAIAASVGLVPGRELYQMRRSLPTGIAYDLDVRAFRVGDDEERWLDVNNTAFAEHPEQGGWDRETLLAREKEPWFDPEGFLLHEIGGELAGFCWTKIHRNTQPVLGEIYAIAVHPSFGGRGLGTALTLAGLDVMARRGVPMGMLYVDADNATAVAMYRAIGFDVHHSDKAFVGRL
ncbi:MAG: mycothiol synthase [Acidimicrobiia bacterium]